MKRFTSLAMVAFFAIVAFGSMLGNASVLMPFENKGVPTGFAVKTKAALPMPENAIPVACYAISEMVAGENNDLITETPEGELKRWERHGMCYGTRNGVTYETAAQEGLLSIVTAPDGQTVYLKEFVSASAGMGGWVKGTLSGNGETITVPTGQNLAYLTTEKRFLRMYVLDYDKAKDTFVIDESADNVTLTLVDNTWKLNGTGKEKILGLVYSDDNSWTLYGDYESGYTPFKDTFVEVPADLTTDTYRMEARNSFGNTVTVELQIGYAGDDVYVRGFCAASASEGWVKGTKDADGNLTIPSGQLTGFRKDFYPIYFLSANVSGSSLKVSDMRLVYDKTAESFSSDQWVFESTSKSDALYLESYNNISLTKVEDIEISTDVIDKQPEGVEKVFSRTGLSYYISDGTVYSTPQNGYLMRIVYAPDGKTVYMKDAISMTSERTWVKGTIDGDKITVPLYQCVYYDEYTEYGLATAKLVLDASSGTFVPDFSAKEVTFTVDSATGKISLDNFDESGNSIYGLITTSIYQWNGYGDSGSVYVPFDGQKTVIPENLKKEKWSFQYIRKYDNSYDFVDVAFDGDKIYIAGLPKLEEDAAIVGTVKDGKAVFESDQFICVLEEFDVAAYLAGTVCVYDEYDRLVDYTYTPTFEMAYDSEKKTLTATEKTAMLFNGGKPSELIQNILACINAKFGYYEEYAAVPATPKFISYADYTATHGYVTFELDIPIVDTDGKFVDPAKMAYQIFVRKDGEETPFVFRTDKYHGISEDMEIIPYEFSDDYDIYAGGIRVYLYTEGVDDVAVQSINYSGGEERRSDKVWYSASGSVGHPENEGKEVVGTVYHDLNGVRVMNPDRGIFVKTVIYEDGTSETTKIVKTK